MTLVRTDQKLLDALRRAAATRVTAQEIKEQRVNFIISSMDEDAYVTRERVESQLRLLDGQAA